MKIMIIMQYFLTNNEEMLCVNFFYEVLDIMISEIGRFNQGSRQYLTLLGDLQNRKMADESKLTSIVKSFCLDPIALKTEWTLLINNHVIDVTKPYLILQHLAEKEKWCLCWPHLAFKDVVYNPIHKCHLWKVFFKIKSAEI